MIELVLHLVLLLVFPPLLLGVIGKTKAFVAGRKGPPLVQPYRDVWRLLRKGAVYSNTTTWLFRAGPIVTLAATLIAGLLLPLASDRAPLAFAGDLIAFAYLLGLARFFTMAAALDTGSSFEGMGASREAAFSALAEPALFLALAILAVQARAFSFEGALGSLSFATWSQHAPILLLACVALGAVLLAENARIPVDDPNTHLELTMIHEVMVLDHGGPDFAFILYGASIKLFLFGALLLHMALPIAVVTPAARAGLVATGEIVLAVGIGIVESVMARLRLSRVPQFLIAASVLAAVGVVILLARGNP